MYSLVLLTALSTGADVTPAPGAPAAPVAVAPMVSGCSGCCGYSLSCSGCYGSCYGSCHGSCHGRMFSGGFCSCHGGGLFSHKSSCHGCCGGYSCCGGYAGYPYSSWSYGSTWGPPIGMPPYTSQGYNQGGMYGWGPPTVWGGPANPNAGAPGAIPPSAGTDKPADMTKPTVPVPAPASDKKTGGMGAILKFRVPADTTLYFDGKMVDFVKGSERVFSTPPLPAGQKFFYDVRAERKVGGALIVQDMRVFVEAGATIEESMMDKLASADEKKADAVAGK
jgi:uncharacterized protein (TIGR03000 family)